ncbi:MAG: TadE/TadG family type IV pilus assembly protein [Devosia sp.]
MSQQQSLLRRFFAPAISRGHAFSRDERGVTVIEFGILALPFFTIIFAIIETAMVFLAGQVLDSAVEDASRVIKTGEAQQTTGYTIASFRTYLCGYTFSLFDCTKILIRIAPISKFTSVSTTPTVQTCTSTTCTWTVTDLYTPGVGRDIVQVFAYYRYPLLLNLPYFNFRNQPDNYRLLSATRVFRNEPFS